MGGGGKSIALSCDYRGLASSQSEQDGKKHSYAPLKDLSDPVSSAMTVATHSP